MDFDIPSVFRPDKGKVFPNGEVFLIRCNISSDKAEWCVPPSLLEPLSSKLTDVPLSDLLGSHAQAQMAAWLATFLGMSPFSVRWRAAVGYSYRRGDPPAFDSAKEPAIFNEDYLPDFERLPPIRENRYLQIFKTSPFCAGIIAGREFVSLCFHSGNGTSTVETAPEHRRRAYASSCLRLLTKRTIEAGIRPGYGTEEGNVAARRTAESVGYELDLRMFWVTVDSENSGAIPAFLEKEMECLS